MMNYCHWVLLGCLFFSGCRDEPASGEADQAVEKKKEFLESGVDAALIRALDKPITVLDLLLKLELVTQEDEGEEALALVDYISTENGVNLYSLLGGGLEFTTRYNPSENRDGFGIYSERILDDQVTSVSYSIRGIEYFQRLE